MDARIEFMRSDDTGDMVLLPEMERVSIEFRQIGKRNFSIQIERTEHGRPRIAVMDWQGVRVAQVILPEA